MCLWHGSEEKEREREYIKVHRGLNEHIEVHKSGTRHSIERK